MSILVTICSQAVGDTCLHPNNKLQGHLLVQLEQEKSS